MHIELPEDLHASIVALAAGEDLNTTIVQLLTRAVALATFDPTDAEPAFPGELEKEMVSRIGVEWK